MTYQIISTTPAARENTYYKVEITEGECRVFKYHSDASQEDIDNLVTETLQMESEVAAREAELKQLIADGIIEDSFRPSGDNT